MKQALQRLRYAPGSAVQQQLEASGYFPEMFTAKLIEERAVSGRVRLLMVDQLRKDARFAKGGLHRLHPEVGKNRIDFRAWSGTFGKGSLQIVIDKKTGRCHCDIDLFNPYQDVVNIVGHAYEVLKGWWT